MACRLSQTLTRLPPSAARLVSLRRRSTSPRLDPAAEDAAAERERAALRKLEDAIHRVIVRRSQPDWLPLVPGASFWVPPRSKANGLAEVIGKLLSGGVGGGGVGGSAAAGKVRSALSLSSAAPSRGWPSSAHFFKGGSHSPLEGDTASKHTTQSEDEEK